MLEAIRIMADASRRRAARHAGRRRSSGIVSERDYARKVILMGRSSADTPVRDIMSAPVLTVQPETTVREVHAAHDRAARAAPAGGRRPVGWSAWCRSATW